MATDDQKLMDVLRAYRHVFNQQNTNMSPAEQNLKFQQHWDGISTKLNCQPTTASMTESLVPQKRPIPGDSHFGLEPSSKRAAAAAAAAASLHVPAPPLLRQTSAPSGRSPQSSPSDLAMMATSMKSKPINIPQLPTNSGRRSSVPSTSHHSRVSQISSFGNRRRICDRVPADDLARMPIPTIQQAPTFAFTAPESGHGEWNTNYPSSFVGSSYEASHSPATTTSDSCLTTAAMVFSEPMSRCNTNDQICETFGMINMDTSLASIPDIFMDGMTQATYPSPLSDSIPEYQSISFSSSGMKHSLSQESDSSSSSDSFSFQFPMSSSVSQSAQVKAPRSIAPKILNDSLHQPTEPKYVAITGEDGVVRKKAEISRAARQPQQRKTQLCDFCNDQPQGFHGEHELRRHMDRQHTYHRKVWICRDISEGGTFLRNCKACRNGKTYGANYNAAAHLRRTHFNPCKNKRGGRGKKSEGRGGMGGGNSPSMEELKQWMFETYEVNLNGRAIVQHMPADSNAPQVSMAELAQFDPALQAADDYSTHFEASSDPEITIFADQLC